MSYKSIKFQISAMLVFTKEWSYIIAIYYMDERRKLNLHKTFSFWMSYERSIYALCPWGCSFQ